MGRISASTGLNTGIDISGTITKLMAIAAKPRDSLTTRNANLSKQQSAVTALSAYLLSVQYVTKNLAKSTVFAGQKATVSDSSALSATVTGSPTAGSYQYTPLRMAASQQLLSSGFESASSALGGGTFTFRHGSRVDQGVLLGNINGGDGFTRGKIRITDRSGASEQVDLSYAQNVDDVLEAINTTEGINVRATLVDGAIRLTDNTGQTASNLKVQEVGSGTTAASLGLSGVNVAAASADGDDILVIANDLLLSALNDGMGVRTNSALPDITYTLHDGTTGTIDLSPILEGSSVVQKEVTLADIVARISDQTDGKLQVTVAGDGQRLVVTDTTAAANPGGTLAIGNAAGSTAASDLGLVVASTGSASATGRRILGGLGTVLLSSLKGGQGIGTLGYMKVTDHDGHAANLNLSGTETLQEVVDAINAQIAAANALPGADVVQITAEVNAAGNGIQLLDATGTTTGTLSAANSDAAGTGDDGLDTAVKLGLATQSAPGSTSGSLLNGGDLHLRAISRNTLLSSLNGGAGVATGSFKVADAAGAATTINITAVMQTVGDVIDAINRNTTGVHADVNANGDGILLQDTTGGTGALKVTEGNTTTARDLNLLVTAAEVGGVSTIDGTTTRTITLAAGETLTNLRDKINTLQRGLSAGILTDGSSRPYRLMLTGSRTGRAGGLVVDASGIDGMALDPLSAAKDALMGVGSGSGSSLALVVASSSNTFNGVLPGVALSVLSATGEPVSVNIGSDDSQVAANLETLVTNYNKFRNELTKNTAYDTTTNTGSILTGDGAALQLDLEFSQLVSGTFAGNGSLQSLAEVGVTVQNDGTLAFDRTVLDAAWAVDPAAVQQLFTTEDTGIAARFNALIDQLAGETTSLLSSRITAIDEQISNNQTQIDRLNARLTREQERLYTSFYNMDIAIGKLKNSLEVINSLTVLDPYTGVTRNS